MVLFMSGLVIGFTGSITCPSNALVVKHSTTQGGKSAFAFGQLAERGANDVTRDDVTEERRNPALSRSGRTRTGAKIRELGKAALSGFSVTAFNPLTLAWYIGLLGPGLAQSGAIHYHYFAGVLFGAVVWFGAVGTAFRMLRRRLPPRILTTIHTAGALVLIAFAGWFAIEGVSRLLAA